MWPVGALLAFLTISVRLGKVHAALLAPTVTLDDAEVTGVALGNTNHFLGIPYAEPPTGDLRFRLPQSLQPYNTSFSALEHGPACPQQLATRFPGDLPTETIDDMAVFFVNVAIASEDCLTIDVITPAGATPQSGLPVLVWIYPGAFEFGSTGTHDGTAIVEKSILLGVPVVYVAMNFRQNAFGFLASQEVKDAGVGNLGLQDQRLALRWVQKYIAAFGGDPTKVTIWGYSSGAISVGLHMITNGGNPEGLFRAAFMQGGSPLPVGDITHGQPYYDALVAETGCSGAGDTLQCLRKVPYDVLLNAMIRSPGPISYQSFRVAWAPRVDGVFLTEDPLDSIKRGAIADVPFVSGNCDDEGTLFSIGSLNVTTDAEFEEYIKTYWFPNASEDTIKQVMEYYPSDPVPGSPFNTGYLNALTPQYKRLAALQGDAAGQAMRRFLLQYRSGKQNIWTYLNKRLKLTPFLGSFHASDLPNVYAGLDMTSYLVRFVANLNPNVGEGLDLYWPQYDATNQQMLLLLDGLVPQSLTTDTYRAEEIAYVMNLISENPA